MSSQTVLSLVFTEPVNQGVLGLRGTPPRSSSGGCNVVVVARLEDELVHVMDSFALSRMFAFVIGWCRVFLMQCVFIYFDRPLS